MTRPVRKIVVQNWEESERGWGTRPDGFTVHVDRKQCDEYINWFNATFNDAKEAPDEYTRTDGDPFEVVVSEELYKQIEEASKKTYKGRILKCVHGKNKSFSKKTMSESDLEL